MSFNLNDYEPVADRIEKFWKDHPEGKIITELVFQDERRFVVKAFVGRDSADIHATGYAEEIVGAGNVNRTSALENCETSAIGRALANLGYASKAHRASREEMAKASRETQEAKPIHVAKARLLSAVGGDRERAREIWTKAEASLGIPPEQEPDDPRLVQAVLNSALAEAEDS